MSIEKKHNFHPQFSESDYVGMDQSGARIPQYPPTREGRSTFMSDYSYEKGVNPVTRGSIAAQMAAEGQIPKKAGLKMWRSDEHKGALWKGGRGKCCLRVCGCSIITVLTILLSVIASFLLWTRPPAITFYGVTAPTNSQEVTTTSNGFTINILLNIGVINPNFFGASFKSIKATASYPGSNEAAMGGGELYNVDIPSKSNTTIAFPFKVEYDTSKDSSLVILTDIATKCGFMGSVATNLHVNYVVTLKTTIVGITISPVFSSSVSFECPLSQSDVRQISSSLGIGKRSLHVSEEEHERRAEVFAKVMRSATDAFAKKHFM